MVWDDPAVAWVCLLNPLPLVRWILDQRYLRDLEQRGIPMLPTAFLERAAPVQLADLLRERGWSRAVVKPAISGGAHRTQLIALADASAHQSGLEEMLAATAVLVQPFAPEIQTRGEWSLVFFESRLSHAVRKLPAAVDFRVQTVVGGTHVLPFRRSGSDRRAGRRHRPIDSSMTHLDCARSGTDMLHPSQFS